MGRGCLEASNSCGQAENMALASGKIMEPWDWVCRAAGQGSSPLELYPLVIFELAYRNLRYSAHYCGSKI